MLSRSTQSYCCCSHCRCARPQNTKDQNTKDQNAKGPPAKVPYDPLEMYRVLNRTQKALLATTMLYSMDGELPTYGEVVVYANAIEQRVQGTAALEPGQMINRRHAQDARVDAAAHLHLKEPDLPGPGRDMVVESLLFVRPSKS